MAYFRKSTKSHLAVDAVLHEIYKEFKRHTVRPRPKRRREFRDKIANCEVVAVLMYSSTSKARRK